MRELLEQAGVKFVVMPKDTEYEKFAELIVRECAELCDINDKEQGDILKEHFGVEDRAVPILSADEQALFAGITSSKLFTIAGAKKHFGVKK
jgi:hypothetical protein